VKDKNDVNLKLYREKYVMGFGKNEIDHPTLLVLWLQHTKHVQSPVTN
jgi:hypothetical protein